ncbi:MAG: hypothetical protein GXO79_13565 [Chlorobi bacterium]|nr:hypothetical protein [Chlorobiota bacterium]
MIKLFKNNIWLIAGILFLITGCIKEAKYETLYPKAYFPAYPGSYWIYSNGQTKTTDAYYRLHTINSTDYYVPVYEGEIVNGYKVGDKEIINFDGNPWVVGSFDDGNILRKIETLDTTILITQFPYYNSTLCDTILEEITEIPIDTLLNLVQVISCDGYENCDTVLINCDDPHACDTLYYTLTEEIVYYDTTFTDTIITGCDSISIYDSVIVVKEYSANMDELNCWFYKDYYAKNIGLVKREVASCSDSTGFITEFELVKYHINK